MQIYCIYKHIIYVYIIYRMGRRKTQSQLFPPKIAFMYLYIYICLYVYAYIYVRISMYMAWPTPQIHKQLSLLWSHLYIHIYIFICICMMYKCIWHYRPFRSSRNFPLLWIFSFMYISIRIHPYMFLFIHIQIYLYKYIYWNIVWISFTYISVYKWTVGHPIQFDHTQL
jgi:hypothetical protein